MGVELPLCVVVTILESCVMFSGVKLSIRSFALFLVSRLERNSSVLDALIFAENCLVAKRQRVFDQELSVYCDGG